MACAELRAHPNAILPVSLVFLCSCLSYCLRSAFFVVLKECFLRLAFVVVRCGCRWLTVVVPVCPLDWSAGEDSRQCKSLWYLVWRSRLQYVCCLQSNGTRFPAGREDRHWVERCALLYRWLRISLRLMTNSLQSNTYWLINTKLIPHKLRPRHPYL